MVWAYDRVGDILITTIPPSLESKEQLLGNTLLELHPGVKVVVKRVGTHSGQFRTRTYRILAGEQRFTTLHKENGLFFHLDLQSVYYSVRMAGERLRIARLVGSDEKIGVIGSGVGSFPLTLAQHGIDCEIVGIEKNPIAHHYALTNVAANKTPSLVQCLQGDAFDLLPSQNRRYDRLLTCIPLESSCLLDLALDHLKSGGTLHHYEMVSGGNIEKSLQEIERSCLQRSLTIQSLEYHRCGHCGPNSFRYCFTLTIQ